MTFRYENKIQLGDDSQILNRNSTWRCLLDTRIKFNLEMTLRYLIEIRLGDVFQIRKYNSTWSGLLYT